MLFPRAWRGRRRQVSDGAVHRWTAHSTLANCDGIVRDGHSAQGDCVEGEGNKVETTEPSMETRRSGVFKILRGVVLHMLIISVIDHHRSHRTRRGSRRCTLS